MRRRNGKTGYTLLELCVTLVVISVTAAIFFPVITNCRDGKPQQTTCASNLKQIGVAALMYAQDNDDRLPPAIAFHDEPNYQTWLRLDRSLPYNYHGFLSTYTTNEKIFVCPEKRDQVMENGHIEGAAFLNNDLCGGAEMQAFVAPWVSVIVIDGVDSTTSVGHAYDADFSHPSQPAVWNYGSHLLISGEVVNHAATRHSGGANYLFADGHVEWNKPKNVFFPPRESTHRTHLDPKTGKPIGPDPGGDMIFNGKKYTATFHLR